MFLKLIISGLLLAGASLVLLNQVISKNYASAEPLEHKTVTHPEVSAVATPKIAIIGSGIGGSSSAYFVRELLGPSAHIDVFESSSKVGGRLSVVDYDDIEVEAGGTIIHEANKYMVMFTEKLGLETFKAAGEGQSGIYDGKEMIYMESKYDIISKLKLMWRYGLFSLWHLDSSLSKMIDDFSKIYTLQNDGHAYRTVPEMLKAMGGDDFVDMLSKTAEETMLEKRIGVDLIHEVVAAVTRSIYDQDASVNGFAGFVSMAGGQPGALFSVKGGNWGVCKQLLEKADAFVFLDYPIERIQKTEKDGKTVYYLDKRDQGTSVLTAYDAVIVAAPLEVRPDFIACEKCKSWPSQDNLGHYQRTIANFVRAHLNFKTFGFDKDNVPTDIVTTENKDLKFSSIGILHSTDGKLIDSPPLYKVFSREKLSNETVKEIFRVHEDTKVVSVSWLAYPKYTPPEKFVPFVLDDGVFYVNAIERAASCMEMSAIGGRNAALWVHKYLNGTV